VRGELSDSARNKPDLSSPPRLIPQACVTLWSGHRRAGTPWFVGLGPWNAPPLQHPILLHPDGSPHLDRFPLPRGAAPRSLDGPLARSVGHSRRRVVRAPFGVRADRARVRSGNPCPFPGRMAVSRSSDDGCDPPRPHVPYDGGNPAPLGSGRPDALSP